MDKEDSHKTSSESKYVGGRRSFHLLHDFHCNDMKCDPVFRGQFLFAPNCPRLS
jgi:hypothetical protein